jgi:hypothetical protein
VADTLRRLELQRRVVEGEFRPGSSGAEWCDAEVLRRLRSRSLAALRHEVEPVDAATYGRFLTSWQHLDEPLRGIDGVAQVIEQLAGVAVPASALETLVLPSRVRDYSPAMLDELTATGEVAWAGAGSLGSADGWVTLHLAETMPFTLGEVGPLDETELHRSILDALARRWRLLLPAARRHGREPGRQGAHGGDLGSRVGGTRDERHPRSAPLLCWRQSTATSTPHAVVLAGMLGHRTAEPVRRAERRRPVVARAAECDGRDDPCAASPSRRACSNGTASSRVAPS